MFNFAVAACLFADGAGQQKRKGQGRALVEDYPTQGLQQNNNGD